MRVAVVLLVVAVPVVGETRQELLGELEHEPRMALSLVAERCGSDVDEMTDYLLVQHGVMQRNELTETLAQLIAVAYMVAKHSSLDGSIVSTVCVEWIVFYVGLRLVGLTFGEAVYLVEAMIPKIQELRTDTEEVAKELGVPALR